MWSPIDIHSRIETAIEKLPDERGRSAWFERHFGDVALVLTRPTAMFQAFYHILDYFTETVAGGQAIHIRTARRGEYAWIGVGAAPNERTAESLALDERIRDAGAIWGDLGGNMVTGENEVRILLPLHGPVHLFHAEAGESAGEKTT